MDTIYTFGYGENLQTKNHSDQKLKLTNVPYHNQYLIRQENEARYDTVKIGPSGSAIVFVRDKEETRNLRSKKTLIEEMKRGDILYINYHRSKYVDKSVTTLTKEGESNYSAHTIEYTNSGLEKSFHNKELTDIQIGFFRDFELDLQRNLPKSRGCFNDEQKYTFTLNEKVLEVLDECSYYAGYEVMKWVLYND